MNRKMSKRQKDIKSKLMAAIAMLLVSSIMMVSTTYAWFTLSTAPEVTGISTAVGANGNLEMALLPVYGNETTLNLTDFGITSGTSDSMANQAANLANVTWGNLVDLTTYYGLENITLYPSEVNATLDETTKVPTNILDANGAILKTPKYGADGRISSLTANTISGVYLNNKAEQTVTYTLPTGVTGSTSNPAGVRLIGTVSNMTDRQAAFRDATSKASQASTSGFTAARSALDSNGDQLAEIAIKYALNGDDAKFTNADVATLTAVVNGMNSALAYIEEGIRQYTYAYQISISTTEESYKELTTTILGDASTKPAASSLTSYMPADWYTDSEGVVSMMTTLAGAKAKLTDATSKLSALTDNEHTWGEIQNAMSNLMDVSKMYINEYPIMKDGKVDAELEGKVGALVLKQEKINLNMPSGSGVFADVADFVGTYSASVDVPASIVVEKMEDVYLTVYMYAKAKDYTYFKEAKADAEEKSISGAGEGATQAISDYYGYVIDLAFKTNAADSYVKLQTDAVDRIYTDGTQNESTQGGGATMIFTSQDPENGFDATRMTALMKHIRIIFFDPESASGNEVLGFGVLDADHIVPDPTNEAKVSVGLALATSPFANENGEYDLIKDNKLVDLEQNIAKRVSVLVYLDGTTLTNADVAIGADTSMIGSLNLQFSSSEDLVAMEYSDFVEGSGSGSGDDDDNGVPEVTGTVTPTVTIDKAVTDLTATSVSTVALSDGGFGFEVTGYDAAKHVVAVTINNGTSVNATHTGNGAFACKTTETVESVAINITAATQG